VRVRTQTGRRANGRLRHSLLWGKIKVGGEGQDIEFGVVDRNKVVVEAGGVKIPVISVEHLKELKRISGRPQDLADLQALQDLQQEEEES